MITVKTKCPSSNDGNTWLFKTCRRILQPQFLIVIFFVGLASQQLASADPLDNLDFEATGYTLNDNLRFDVAEETFDNIVNNLILGDNDCAEKGHGPISVTVKSTRSGNVIDQISLQAIEISDPSAATRSLTANTCIFGNTFLNLSPDNQRFHIGDSITITQQDTTGGRTTDNTITTIDVTIKSDSDTVGITKTLGETGPNTGIFKGKVLLTSGGSSANTALRVSAGDIITTTYSGKKSYGQIQPSPSGTKGLLVADVGDIITAAYAGLSASQTIIVGGGGGGGGGGLVRPGLVLDFVATVGGSSSGSLDSSPPSLALDRSSIERLDLPEAIKTSLLNADPFKPIGPLSDTLGDFPLSIDDKGFPLMSYANTIVTNVEETEKLIPLKLRFNEESAIDHVAIYTNFAGASGEIAHSDTSIIYDRGKPLQVTDPQGLFSDVKLVTIKNGTKYEFFYNITFAKPMKQSDIIIRSWDEKRNSRDIKIFDAWKVVEANKTMTRPVTVPDKVENRTLVGNVTSLQNSTVSSDVAESQDLLSSIKKWGGYYPESISDSQLLEKIGIKGQHIPSWFMKTTRWLLNNQTTQEEFFNAIKYLYEIKVIE